MNSFHIRLQHKNLQESRLGQVKVEARLLKIGHGNVGTTGVVRGGGGGIL